MNNANSEQNLNNSLEFCDRYAEIVSNTAKIATINDHIKSLCQEKNTLEKTNARMLEPDYHPSEELRLKSSNTLLDLVKTCILQVKYELKIALAPDLVRKLQQELQELEEMEKQVTSLDKTVEKYREFLEKGLLEDWKKSPNKWNSLMVKSWEELDWGLLSMHL